MDNKDFLDQVQAKTGTLTKKDSVLLDRAYNFGKTAHTGQKRASGEDYFTTHCVMVALNVASFGMDANMIAAGLLHDTIEDTTVTKEQIEELFGVDIAQLVEGVSKLGKLKYRGNERHVESLRKFFISVAKDVRVVILKLADRLHNLETLHHLKEEKRQRIAQESILIYAPLASRLNMGKVVAAINNLAFPYAYPEAYEKTKKIMDEKLKDADATVEKMFKGIAKELASELGYAPIIDRRVKGLFSLYKKLERKDWNIDDIYDIVALRAIVKDEIDCYLALGIIHAHWRPVPGRVKDYIAVPKPNGYQSLHTTVFSGDGPIVEIQLRTETMHDFNELGIASHHSYKQKNTQSGSETFHWIDQLRDMQSLELSQSEYLKRLKTDFFQDRIFALTPKGDVIDLPAGATVLDFAFAVHSEIGKHTSGGKINGKFVGIKSVLSSEDIVEIVTDKKAKPSSKWLESCITNQAQSKIRGYLKKASIKEV